VLRAQFDLAKVSARVVKPSQRFGQLRALHGETYLQR